MNLLLNNSHLICRVCLNTSLHLHNIFTKAELSSSTIASLLMECAPIEIAPEDGLPNQICVDCLGKVKNVQQFRNQIITSDTTLKQQLQSFSDIKPNIWIFDDTKDAESVDVPDISSGFKEIDIKKEDISVADKGNLEIASSKKQNIKSKAIKKRKNRGIKILNESIKQEFEVKVPRTKKKTYYYDRRIGGPFKCDQCERTCTTKGGLDLHKRRHTGEKPHMCDICGKSFPWGSYLTHHRRIHTGEYRFQCDFCTKRFVTSNQFKNHRRIHTGERPYKCDNCEKSFKQKSQLRVHKRIHGGEFNYECDTCHKRFKVKCVLIKHKRIHTGEQPYECPLCSKKFSQSASLYNHNRLVHKISSSKPISKETKNENDLLNKA